MKLVFHEAALADLQGIYDYLNEENSGVAVSVIARIKASLERLTAFPKSGRVGVVPEPMRLLFPVFPILLFTR